MQAVVTGDLIDSTKYTPEELNIILNVLNEEFKYLNGSNIFNSELKIYRGDSFQGVMFDPSLALELVLSIKTSINRLLILNKKVSGLPDFRIAIGIGSISLKRDSILESNGEAFQFSGRTLEQMKGDYPRLLLKTSNKNIDDEFNVHFSFLDSVTSKWSRESAEVVYFLLRDYKEREIAEKLRITQSAVNHRKKAANWDSIAILLKRYKTIISSYINSD